ncbi:hypothetical protein KTV79_11955 [Planococcus sp. CP5-4_UN]|uniref:hypothetical protein n=1 Tax=Planococcus sp. CP5-4_UN TaxID=2850852 RepID=UPI001C2CB466|nr:hypothetical protein [Planococcus sp. CP5-4_UN]MBV0909794.1 hypothetical protein [Planococcus sp. CP5-4_UN]
MKKISIGRNENSRVKEIEVKTLNTVTDNDIEQVIKNELKKNGYSQENDHTYQKLKEIERSLLSRMR